MKHLNGVKYSAQSSVNVYHHEYIILETLNLICGNIASEKADCKVSNVKKRFKVSKVRNLFLFVVLFVLVVLIFDVVAVKLWPSYFQQKYRIAYGVDIFISLEKSELTMVSDLLFGEGAVMLSLGGILAVGGSKTSILSEMRTGRYYKEKKMANDYVKSHSRRVRFGILLMIVGAILLGTAVIITIV